MTTNNIVSNQLWQHCHKPIVTTLSQTNCDNIVSNQLWLHCLKPTFSQINCDNILSNQLWQHSLKPICDNFVSKPIVTTLVSKQSWQLCLDSSGRMTMVNTYLQHLKTTKFTKLDLLSIWLLALGRIHKKKITLDFKY